MKGTNLLETNLLEATFGCLFIFLSASYLPNSSNDSFVVRILESGTGREKESENYVG